MGVLCRLWLLRPGKLNIVRIYTRGEMADAAGLSPVSRWSVGSNPTGCTILL